MVFSAIKTFFVGNKTLMIGIGLGIALLGLFYFYYQTSQATIREANKKIGQLEVVVETIQEERKQQQKILNLQIREMQRLSNDVNSFREDANKLAKLFSDHDLRNIIQRKPTLLDRKQNRETQKLFDELEEITDPRTYHNDE